MEIRTLRADEIDARVQTVKETGCSILLYKDARCDMKVLDETFGITGWKRDHEVINGNLFCNVHIWDKENKQWITKQDIGTESFAAKEKGEASDAFKRACFNVGIGRELYTAPFIWIRLGKAETYPGKGGKLQVKTKFNVTGVRYNTNQEIIGLQIKDDKGVIRYSLGKVSVEKVDATKVEALIALAKEKQTDVADIENHYNVKIEDMDIVEYTGAISILNKKTTKG